ncbi:MAG: hypothetical protein JO336_14075 [Acidobacteriia bacterium]|nr:hypothetical protein [Terriglobia bacterium]MBV8906481.1 hypothetical protein [Terriglobia bacterium]MBV9743494.1 hypothetical protein [Terriglobia bacterium]
MNTWKLFVPTVLLGLLAIPGHADVVVTPLPCVTNNSTAGGWTSVGSPVDCPVATATGADPLLPVTFVLPEPGSDTAPEPVGDFQINRTLVLPNPVGEYWTITEEGGSIISDFILVDNKATVPGFTGRVLFYSDPAAPTTDMLTGYANLGALQIQEGQGTGGVGGGTFTLRTSLGEQIGVVALSDGPTPVAGLYSDAIQFSLVPEPSFFAMTAAGASLIALLLRRRRLS